jgi:hypothetical protein
MAQREDMMAMTEARAAAILSAYGADPARWPQGERVALAAWAEAHAQDFAALAAQEAALDAALSHDERGGGDDAALAARILAARESANVVRADFGGRSRGPWAQVAALAACAVLGVAIGFTQAPLREGITAEMDAAFGAAFDLQAMGDGAGG